MLRNVKLALLLIFGHHSKDPSNPDIDLDTQDVSQDRLNCPKTYTYLSSYIMQASPVTNDETVHSVFCL